MYKTYLSLFKDIVQTFYFCFKIDKIYSLKLITIIIKSKLILRENFDLEKIKDKTKYFESKYTLADAYWFTFNYQIWDKFLSNNIFKSYLEIGSYEGRSAVFIGEKFKNIEINCVDIFENNNQHGDINFSKIYNNFLLNIKKLSNKVQVNKMTSDEFFKNNKKKFDLIYIDGSHYAQNVLRDFENSFSVLQDGGILICDDFLFNEYVDINPISAFIPSLKKYHNKIKILYLNHQLIIKKFKS